MLFLLHAKPSPAGSGHRVALEEAMKITYLRVGKVGATSQPGLCATCLPIW